MIRLNRIIRGASPPRTLVSIDGGDPQGLAYWIDGLLAHAHSCAFGPPHPCDVAVVELPDHHVKGKIIDVTRCAARGAAAGAWASRELILVPVQEWKGSVGKEVTRARVLKTLSTAEIANIKSKTTHCYDAIGIGLYYLRRLDK